MKYTRPMQGSEGFGFSSGAGGCKTVGGHWGADRDRSGWGRTDCHLRTGRGGGGGGNTRFKRRPKFRKEYWILDDTVRGCGTAGPSGAQHPCGHCLQCHQPPPKIVLDESAMPLALEGTLWCMWADAGSQDCGHAPAASPLECRRQHTPGLNLTQSMHLVVVSTGTPSMHLVVVSTATPFLNLKSFSWFDIRLQPHALRGCQRRGRGTWDVPGCGACRFRKATPGRTLARATLKCQKLTATTPAVALTQWVKKKGQSGTWFQKLRKQQLLLL